MSYHRTIYVDPLHTYAAVQVKPGARRYGVRWCHLSDTENDTERLHAFALSIGCNRSWYQIGGNGMFPHYDLTPRYRHRAILAGAMQLTEEQSARLSVRQVAERRQFARGDKRYGMVVNASGRAVGVVGIHRVRRGDGRVSGS